MIKGEKDDISKIEDIGIIDHKREEIRKKNPRTTTLLIDGQVVPLLQIIYKVFFIKKVVDIQVTPLL
jgi:hypothetical protein